MAKSTSDIIIRVELGEDKRPEAIHWESTDSAENKQQEVKAFLLSLFDGVHQDTLRIDLWTKDMEIAEMDRLMYTTIKSLADTYMKATSNGQLAGAMQQFANYFGEQTKIIIPEE